MRKSSIEAVEEKLPPGFRFYPRDEELICNYLINKVATTSNSICAMDTTSSAQLVVPQLVEVDLNKSEPWDIPETACVGGKEWYFYSQRDRKYATGLRTNRATATGYWKATGKDRAVYNCSRGTPLLVGMRKTLVFYRGRAPRGTKSNWVMHEFRLEGSSLHSLKLPSSTKDWVLCRMFHKDKVDEESTGKQVSGSSGREVDHNNFRRAQLKPSTSSSSLMDDPYISFSQTHANSNIMMNQSRTSSTNSQVPCFSIFSQNQTMSYYYPGIVAPSVNAPENTNTLPRPLKTRTNDTNDVEYHGQESSAIKPDRDQQNHPLFNSNGKMKDVVNQLGTTINSHDPASSKLKSKIPSSEDFGNVNDSSDRDRYLPESMWRHQQY